jgi:AcrR family transcriptional regulator
MQTHGRQSSAADDTRDRLIDAAARLFAERGIGAVSLREINREAGAKNAVAVQYHFGDRAGIVRAITAKHGPDVDARRHAMLDEYEAKGEDDLRALVAALVRPLASKLDDPNGGLDYLQVHAELTNIPPTREPSTDELPSRKDSMQRWRLLVGPFITDDAARLHRRFAAIRLSALEIGRRARTGPHRDDRLFVSDLIDLVTGMLAAPPSDETTRLMKERDKSRARRV